VAAYRPAILRHIEAHKQRNPTPRTDTYGKAFIQVGNLWEVDDEVARFCLSRRLAKIAADLMAVEGVRMYHDQALFKEAGGGHTPWHQDQHYWPLDTNSTITMWMPLVDVDESMGTMCFASGSHTVGYLGDMPISDKSEEIFRAFVKEKGFRVVNAGAMKAGDATFHSGWTLHSAPGNNSPRSREVMTIIWFPNGVRLLTPDNKNREADLKRWHPGQQPGEVACSHLNPLLYHRTS
jgi:ectoine hydroxylase-related dioxygenase (phytanoyl-CoA dioxygenase family)